MQQKGFASAGAPFALGGTMPQAITAGYLDADAFLDLVVSCADTNNISVHLGLGDGAFGAPASTFAAGPQPSWASVVNPAPPWT